MPNLLAVVFSLFFFNLFQKREVRQREAARVLAWQAGTLSWSAHCIFVEEGGFGYVTVAVSWQDVLAGN